MHNYYSSHQNKNSFNGGMNSSTKIGLGDNQNANKICQWYCCSCGQSYGSIIYKDEIDIAEAAEEKEEDILIKKLKYYSQLLYNGTNPSSPNYECLNGTKILKTPEEPGTEHYFGSMKRRSSSMSDLSGNFKDRLDDSDPVPQSVSTFTSTCASPNNSPLPGFYEYNSKVSLCIPTRFNCHRCNHMMCPYCLKIRLKDLGN